MENTMGTDQKESTGSSRRFTIENAERTTLPLFLGLVGPSNTGKTYSALRLATGIQKVTGGKIIGIDTESKRMRHYAPLPGQKPDPLNGKFDFKHMEFRAPFDSLDYLAAIEQAVAAGAKVVIVDSMSHEHEGPGGVLEQHQAETQRLAKLWKVPESKAQMSAWGPAKAKRRRLINTLMQMQVHAIFCFRAKKKLKIVKGQDPVERGFQPIAGEEFIYEMMLKFLLLPGARGVPTWDPQHEDERDMVKIPGQFEYLFRDSSPLSEDIGEALAQWAAGGDGAGLYAQIAASISVAKTIEQLRDVWPRLEDVKKKKSLPPSSYTALKEALETRKKAIESGAADVTTADDGTVPPDQEPPISEREREPGDDDEPSDGEAAAQ
jgi:hypothetical protein